MRAKSEKTQDPGAHDSEPPCVYRKEEIALPAKVKHREKVLVLPEQLFITILLVGAVLFLGVAVFKVSVNTFQVVQENRRLELEIARLELTHRSLVDEFKQLMTHFEIHTPSE